jgi:hypothetical protein
VTLPRFNVTNAAGGAGAAYEADVPPGALESAVARAVEAAVEAGTEAAVEIKIEESSAPGADAVTVNIPIGGAAAIADGDAGSIRIITPVGEITLDAEAMRDLIAEAGGSDKVGVVIERVTALGGAALTEARKEALKDGDVRVVYNVSAVIGGEKRENFETSGALTVGLPYTLQWGESSGSVWAVRVDTDGSVERMTDGRRYGSGKAYFRTSHLSIYAVAYDAETDTDMDTDTDTDFSGGGCAAGFGLLSLLALVGLAGQTQQKIMPMGKRKK